RAGSAEDYECTFGGNGRTAPTASRNCGAVACRSSTRRLPPARRPDSGACQDTRRSNRPCATPLSMPSAPPTLCPLPSLTRSNRRGTDPYAQWCGRGGTARCPPIPINPVSTRSHSAVLAAPIVPRDLVETSGLSRRELGLQVG